MRKSTRRTLKNAKLKIYHLLKIAEQFALIRPKNIIVHRHIFLKEVVVLQISRENK